MYDITVRQALELKYGQEATDIGILILRRHGKRLFYDGVNLFVETPDKNIAKVVEELIIGIAEKKGMAIRVMRAQTTVTAEHPD